MYGYFCPICYKEHQMNSRIGKEHYPQYLLDREEKDKEAEKNRASQKVPTKEETDKKLYKSIFGD
jgi:hypothetical protein